MKIRIKNSVTLSNRKMNFLYELTTEQLEQFLNDNLDLIITSETDEPQTTLKITSHKDGIIINSPVTQECYNRISKYLNTM